MNQNFKPRSGSLKNTFCIFDEVMPVEIQSLTVGYQSKSGSTYYYTKNGVYRTSNHWGRLANSKWRLVPLSPATESKYKTGFAKWEDFYPDNAIDSLYYLEADFDKKTIQYQHINNPNYDKNIPARTSAATTKRIKQARNIFELESWAKYFDYSDIDELRKIIVSELIMTNKSLEDIKKEILQG